MAILSFRRNTFARNVYLYGNTKLVDIPTEYIEPVKQYGAETFLDSQIKEALDNIWITQQEYDQTMIYKYPEDIILTNDMPLL